MIKQYDDGCHYCIVVMFGVGERGYSVCTSTVHTISVVHSGD